MRLYPPAWIIEREALHDDEIGGYHIETGAVVATSPFVTHRHPKFSDNPEGFDPRRFLGIDEVERPPFAYFPFGGGRRQCIGAGFALLEATIILAMIASRFRLHLVPGHEVRLDPEVTLRALNGILMTVHPLKHKSL